MHFFKQYSLKQACAWTQVFAQSPRSAEVDSRMGRDTSNRTALSSNRQLGPLVGGPGAQVVPYWHFKPAEVYRFLATY